MPYKERFGIRPSSKSCFVEMFDFEEQAVKKALYKSCLVKGSVWLVCIEEEVLYVCIDHQLFRPTTVGEVVRQCLNYHR